MQFSVKMIPVGAAALRAVTDRPSAPAGLSGLPLRTNNPLKCTPDIWGIRYQKQAWMAAVGGRLKGSVAKPVW